MDRSIKDPLAFVRTNILGTVNLLNSFKRIHEDFQGKRFYHISTDEVYGTLGKEGLFEETTPYDPNSPYSASKAFSTTLCSAYGETYGIPYGDQLLEQLRPKPIPEKLILLFINNIVRKTTAGIRRRSVHRDWLYVVDHARAIDLVYHEGENAETYNIGGFNEWTNIDLIKVLCAQMDEKLGREKGSSEKAHYLRKTVRVTTAGMPLMRPKSTRSWAGRQALTFEEGLAITIDWYLSNAEWLKNVTSGTYQEYYDNMYAKR